MKKSIAEVAALSGFSVPTLRYYEQEGILPKVPRDGAGNRVYGSEQMMRIDVVRCLRRAGLSLEEIKHYFRLVEEGATTLTARRELMIQSQKRVQKRFDELADCLNFLRHKIRYYDACCEAQAAGRALPAYKSE